MQVSMAQIRVKSGDIEGNLARILGALAEVPESADVVLFPEMCVSGYNCGCLFEYSQFIEDCQSAVKKIAHAARPGLIVVIGSPRFAAVPRDDSGNVRLHNSAFVLQDGKTLHVYDKRVLANDYHHEDRKYFVTGLQTPIVPGLPLAVLICEDIWHDEVIEDLMFEKLAVPITALLVLNFSYYCAGKQAKRYEVAQRTANRGLDVYYVNAIGIGDISKNILLYDGASFICHSDGGILEAPRYSSGVYTNGNMWTPVKSTWESDTWDAMTAAIRWSWEEFGLKCAQVHLSGGIDSSIVAALAVTALGKKNVRFVTNPGEHTSSVTLNLARRIANGWDVPLQEVSVTALENTTEKLLSDFGKVSPIVKSTISAVGRTVIGLALTNQQFANGIPAGILATGNQTENILGWCNFHDIGSIGVMQPIGDLTKTELFLLCAWLNKEFGEPIPHELLDGTLKPMAELADTDVDPFDYYLYSGICAEMLRSRATPSELLDQFDSHKLNVESFPGKRIYEYGRIEFVQAVEDAFSRAKRSVYKSAQHAPVLVLSSRARGFSARETLFNHYKWSAAPVPTGRSR